MKELSFAELFEIELEGWRYGIEKNQKNLNPQLIHNVIKEMTCVFEIALKNHHPFNLVELANKYSKASKGIVHPKEVAFYVLSVIPNPSSLDEAEKDTLQKVLNQVDEAFGGATERMQKRWQQKSA